MLGRALNLLPEAWGDGLKIAVVAGVIAVCLVVPVLMLLAAFSNKPAPLADAPARDKPSASQPKTAKSAAAALAPDLDPDEWVSGDVIHYDRQKSFGFIRCDRVKGHVRFQAADFKRAPRVGEKVRFKGRHGARRKPVADVVELLPGAKRAS